jgi:hypothetical protein
VAQKVEQNANELCPFKMIERFFENAESPLDRGGISSDFGEGSEFDVLKSVRTLFDAFGLAEDAMD